MRKRYQSIRIGKEGLGRIDRINEIITEYQKQGYTLTLRQVYYQLVARAPEGNQNAEKQSGQNDHFESDETPAGVATKPSAKKDKKSKKKKQDKTREKVAESQNVSESTVRRSYELNVAINAIAEQTGQLVHDIVKLVEKIKDKDVLKISKLPEAELKAVVVKLLSGKVCILIYLGDHDPSGLDMTRDIRERLSLFGASVDVRRIALNRDQIEQYDPPVNPAKITDTRAKAYIKEHGVHSWELDALKPEVIDGLITNAIKMNLDPKRFSLAQKREESERQTLWELVLSVGKQ